MNRKRQRKEWNHFTLNNMEEDIKTVFTIRESEIPKGIKQCSQHPKWNKVRKNEYSCVACPTVRIVNDEDCINYD